MAAAAVAGAAAAGAGGETLQEILTLNKLDCWSIPPIAFVAIDRAFAEIGISLADVQEKIDAHFFDDKVVLSAVAEIIVTSRASTGDVIVDTSLQPPHAFSGDAQYLKPTTTDDRLVSGLPGVVQSVGSIVSASGRFIEFCGVVLPPADAHLRPEMYRFRCQRCGQGVDMEAFHDTLGDHPVLHEWANFVQLHRHETTKPGRA